MLSKIKQLVKTMNFDFAALAVFNRLVLGEGPGLLVLWGGNPGDKVKVNKSYFLDMVEAFEQGGAAPSVVSILPEQLQEVLQQLEPGHYQCVRVKEDCHLSSCSNIYRMPLSIAVPLAIAGAAHRRGLVEGCNLVILCDDIQEFMHHNQGDNERFLRELATSLDNQISVTFLGASQLTWNPNEVLEPSRVLPLGWD